MIDIGGPVDAARRGEELRATSRRSAGRATTGRCSRSCARRGELSLETRRSLGGDGLRRHGRLRGGDRGAGSPSASRSPSASSPPFEKERTSPTARTRTSAPPTTPSGAPARTCSRASSSCTAASSRSTTSTTSTRRGCSPREFALPACVIVKHANPCGVAVGASIEEAYAARSPPTRSRPTAASSSSTGRSAPSWASGSPSSSSRCCSRPATTRRRSRRCGAKESTADPRRRRAAAAGRGERDYTARARRPARAGPRLGRRGPRGRWRPCAASRARPTGATCSSPGASASTSPRTRS